MNNLVNDIHAFKNWNRFEVNKQFMTTYYPILLWQLKDNPYCELIEIIDSIKNITQNDYETLIQMVYHLVAIKKIELDDMQTISLNQSFRCNFNVSKEFALAF